VLVDAQAKANVLKMESASATTASRGPIVQSTVHSAMFQLLALRSALDKVFATLLIKHAPVSLDLEALIVPSPFPWSVLMHAPRMGSVRFPLKLGYLNVVARQDTPEKIALSRMPFAQMHVLAKGVALMKSVFAATDGLDLIAMSYLVLTIAQVMEFARMEPVTAKFHGTLLIARSRCVPTTVRSMVYASN